MALDGELSPRDYERVKSHTNACWTCRTRQHEIEATISQFIQAHRQSPDVRIPPSDGPRALLKARLAQLTERQRKSRLRWAWNMPWQAQWTILGAACALAAMTYFLLPFRPAPAARQMVIVTIPDPSLTPGAMALVSRGSVCKAPYPNNKIVPAALQRRVFDEYGMPSADPSAYEIDYLITPALGGADDIHNLWPQSNRATVWNSLVKDALENHLRDLVCSGQLDLATAQREIATNWIGAYKKYFHTDHPLKSFR